MSDAPHAAGAWVLAIETSNPSAHDDPPAAGVAGAVLRSDGSIGEVVGVPLGPGARHDDGLMPAIERVRGALGVAPEGLARVCVSVGPGGYTGLRVAVTTARMLGEATGAEVVGVPSAAVVAAGLRLSGVAAVCLASKRESTHVTLFGADCHPIVGDEIGVVGPDGLAGLGAEILIADRFLPDAIRLRAKDLGLVTAEPRFSAASCLSVGLLLRSGPAASVLPVYAREPEAVRLWKARPSE